MNFETGQIVCIYYTAQPHIINGVVVVVGARKGTNQFSCIMLSSTQSKFEQSKYFEYTPSLFTYEVIA